jgi:hypothetical protein
MTTAQRRDDAKSSPVRAPGRRTVNAISGIIEITQVLKRAGVTLETTA